jgi:hypothetical protein
MLAASCAAPLVLGSSVDPFALLEPGALAYARLSGAASRDLAPALFPASALASLKPLLARTRLVALGLGSRASTGAAGEIVPPDRDPRAGAFQAVLLGDYPFRSASLSLASSPEWRREKSAFYNAAMGMRAAVPGPGLVLASTGPIEPLLAAAEAPGSSPIPSRLSELASRELVLWAPEPFSGLAGAVLGEPMEVPARGLLIAASPGARGGGDYEATIVFLMDDSNSVRVYKGALKLAWYGMAKALFGAEAEKALAIPFAAEGELYLARAVPLTREALARVLGALRPGADR